MQTKLALINYYYTEISMISEVGGAFYRPMFFDFPNDNLAYVNQTNNIMLGKNLKVSVQSGENETKTETDFYFPMGNWCSVFNTSSPCIQGPANVTLPSRIYQFFVHIKDGSIVPLQTDLINDEGTATKTWDVQQNPIDLHIHPQYELAENQTGNCNASGRFLNDDGKTL